MKPFETAHTSSNVVLCPGQGAQHPGMGKAWVQQSDAARRIFTQADQVLGFPLSQICFEGPEDQLERTDISQAAIYTTSVACFRALEEAGQLGRVEALAGLSLGEFTALHLAGAFDFPSGLRLVRLRGQAMQQAAQATPGGMVALVGADESQADELCQQARGSDVLVPANLNCPGQIVISGARDACQRALTLADQRGFKATALKVAGAFHSPLMQPAADKLAQALDDVAWEPLAAPVISNVTARPHNPADVASIKKLLVDQLTSPVRWSDSMMALTAQPWALFLELAPGKVLSGLMRRIDRRAVVKNFSEPAPEAVSR